MIRLILARHLTKYGAPDSEKFTEMRADQRRQVATPLHHDIAKVVQGRLVHLPSDQGLDSIDAVIQPVTPEEAAIYSVPTGTELPRSLSRKVSRCLCDTADVLVERRIITSGDTLARLVPQVIAGLRAGSFEDSRLRKLYASMYCAFRRRRSLLLLNLENQVRLHEVPWIAAIERFQIKNIEAMELSRQTLKEITVLTLRAFPQAIIPNKLLRELRALAKGADLDLPLVEELAADIFMDSFSPKFTQAAKRAEAYLDGSLYARYFELDGEIARGWPEKESGPLMSSIRGAIPSHSFVATCKARAGIDETTNWGVARNGMIIEQAQILTTHNLALLFQTLELDHDLRQELYAMAEQCFIWICRRQQAKSNHRHASLIMLKNTAYAWRQMIFYLSVMPHSEIAAFLNWAEDHLGQQTEAFRIRFGPAWRGLALAQKGHSFGDEAMNAEKLRRFLGWTNSAHWLLGPGP